MIALAYLALVTWVADALARRWFTYVSWPHRLATAILIGLPLGAWVSYLAAFILQDTGDPLLLGNVVAAWLFTLLAVFLWRRGGHPARPIGEASLWDRIVIGIFVGLVSWMMMSTFRYADGTLGIAVSLWSDFGPTTAIAQSFALGDNFPTEYPHFALDQIRYHFLYYFQVGNLTSLGLDPALANNLMSIGSMVSMLILVMALGQRLFRSALVGRIGASLFFFHGSLSFIPFLGSFQSIGDAIDRLPNWNQFVASGFPYRGEEWGVWTQIVFLNQRHLAGAIGILLIIVLFLLDRLGEDRSGAWPVDVRQEVRRRRQGVVIRLRRTFAGPGRVVRETARDPSLPGYVLCGLLAGLLPLWNGSMFVAAAAVLGAWLVLFPNRPAMIVLAIAAAIPAIPQLVAVQPGTMAGQQVFPSLHWGFIVDDPNIVNVGLYLGFIFGPKLILSAVALTRSTWRQWRVFAVFCGLLGVAFLAQLSVELLANHKFINAWLVVINVFAAFGIVVLWQVRDRLRVPARAVAVALVAVIGAGGVIDLLPVKNQLVLETTMEGDPLFEWVRNETEPRDVFLSDIYVVHRVLLAGRRLYYGWPYFAWSAGHDVETRERNYRELFATRSTQDLVRHLQAEQIAFVAFDDGLRDRGFVHRLNEELFRRHFEVAFEDRDGQYENLTIYRVPASADAADALPGAPLEDMYVGGVGSQPGAFDAPAGIAVDRSGSVLVADTGNDRIQRFSWSGNLLDTIGSPGSGDGQFLEPQGVAVRLDRSFAVADTGNRRVQFFSADGAFEGEWTGPTGGFGAPVAAAYDREGGLYVLDAARRQIVRRDADESTIVFDNLPSTEGPFSTPAGLAVAANRVAVGDPANARVVIYSTDGAFDRAIPVPEWQASLPAAVGVALDDSGTMWLSSPAANAILVYRADGSVTGSLEPTGDDALDGPFGLALKPGGALFVVNSGASRITLLTQVHP